MRDFLSIPQAIAVGVVGLWVSFAPGQKPPRAERATIDNVAQFDFEDTQFDMLCWTMGATAVCAEGVQLVDSGIEAFGARSLAAASDEFVVTFDPPIATVFQFSMALDPNSSSDRPSVDCSGTVREPPGASGPGEVYTTFVVRASECAFSGALLDDLRMWMP